MNEAALFSALLLGLLGGGHCLGMCGGIVAAMSMGLPGQGGGRRFALMLAYNLGRLVSYSLAGALAGGIGLLVAGVLPVAMAQKALLLTAALFMLLMGLYVSGWWNGLALIERQGGHLWRKIEPLGRKLLPVRNPTQALLLGLVWGWLPCGLVYSMLVTALSSGGAIPGAALMLAFGLGTLPNLLLMGTAAAWVAGQIRKPAVRQAAGGLIMIYGLVLAISVIW